MASGRNGVPTPSQGGVRTAERRHASRQGPGSGTPGAPLGGPYDVTAATTGSMPVEGVMDFGAIRIPIPAGGTVAIEPTANGRMQAVHITLPQGRLSVSALAAPRSATLWPELVKEIDVSLRDGGARVRSFRGEWGRELHATTGAATSVFVGVDGPRWMLYGVATGPSAESVALDEQLRLMLRGVVVVRGGSPYPVRTVLPLITPPELAATPESAPAAAAPSAAGPAPTAVPGRRAAPPPRRNPPVAAPPVAGPSAAEATAVNVAARPAPPRRPRSAPNRPGPAGPGTPSAADPVRRTSEDGQPTERAVGPQPAPPTAVPPTAVPPTAVPPAVVPPAASWPALPVTESKPGRRRAPAPPIEELASDLTEPILVAAVRGEPTAAPPVDRDRTADVRIHHRAAVADAVAEPTSVLPATDDRRSTPAAGIDAYYGWGGPGAPRDPGPVNDRDAAQPSAPAPKAPPRPPTATSSHSGPPAAPPNPPVVPKPPVAPKSPVAPKPEAAVSPEVAALWDRLSSPPPAAGSGRRHRALGGPDVDGAAEPAEAPSGRRRRSADQPADAPAVDPDPGAGPPPLWEATMRAVSENAIQLTPLTGDRAVEDESPLWRETREAIDRAAIPARAGGRRRRPEPLAAVDPLGPDRDARPPLDGPQDEAPPLWEATRAAVSEPAPARRRHRRPELEAVPALEPGPDPEPDGESPWSVSFTGTFRVPVAPGTPAASGGTPVDEVEPGAPQRRRRGSADAFRDGADRIDPAGVDRPPAARAGGTPDRDGARRPNGRVPADQPTNGRNGHPPVGDPGRGTNGGRPVAASSRTFWERYGLPEPTGEGADDPTRRDEAVVDVSPWAVSGDPAVDGWGGGWPGAAPSEPDEGRHRRPRGGA